MMNSDKVCPDRGCGALTLYMLENLHALLSSVDVFFKIDFFENIL